MKVKSVFFVVVFQLVLVSAYADDWPGWHGYHRDNRSRETELLKKWPEDGPQMLWCAGELGAGYSSLSISEGSIYVTGYNQANGSEEVIALDLTGKEKWRSVYDSRDISRYAATRTTPTVDNGRLYIFSASGLLVCMNGANGKIQWSADTVERYGAFQIRWYFAESPLLFDGKVICTPGGENATMVALDAETGKEIWICLVPSTKGRRNEVRRPSSSYCSPLLVTLKGRKLIITMLESTVIGVDAETGKLLWSFEHRNYRSIHPNTAIFQDGVICVTSGYNYGGEAWRLSETGEKVDTLWFNKNLTVHHGGAIELNGCVIAASDRGWICVELMSGEVHWHEKLTGKGCLTYADGMIYGYSEKGIVGLIKADRTGVELVSSFKITEGEKEHWAHPVISNGRLYIRHGSKLMSFDVRDRKQTIM